MIDRPAALIEPKLSDGIGLECRRWSHSLATELCRRCMGDMHLAHTARRWANLCPSGGHWV